MQKGFAITSSGRSTRLLTPFSLTVLQQIRLAKLGGVVEELKYYERLIEALQLLEEFFPEALQHYAHMQQVRNRFSLDEVDYEQAEENVGWWQVLAHFFNLIEERGLFEINWDVANQACGYWIAPEYPDRGALFATYLNYIPLKLHGMSHEAGLIQCPPMEMLHALLSDCEVNVVSAELLAEAGLYDALDDWQAQDREAAWRFLHRIEANPGLWPAPIRQIPELARYSCHKTGNIFLDKSFNPYSDTARQSGPWYTWTNHLSQVAESWKRARPVLRWFHRLMQWYEYEPGRLSALAQFIMAGARVEHQPPSETTTIVKMMEELFYELEF